MLVEQPRNRLESREVIEVAFGRTEAQLAGHLREVDLRALEVVQGRLLGQKGGAVADKLQFQAEQAEIHALGIAESGGIKGFEAAQAVESSSPPDGPGFGRGGFEAVGETVIATGGGADGVVARDLVTVLVEECPERRRGGLLSAEPRRERGENENARRNRDN